MSVANESKASNGREVSVRVDIFLEGRRTNGAIDARHVGLQEA